MTPLFSLHYNLNRKLPQKAPRPFGRKGGQEKRMKRWNKKIACLLLAAGLCLQLSGCEALDTTLPDEEETAQSEEQDTLAVDPQGAVDQIYATLGRRIGLVEPTAEQLQSVVGLDPDDYTSAYVRYVETDFGADDVYIVLPKEGEDENGNSHRENIIAQLREFANYDVYNSASIAENAVIFERGGYVVMLMLEDNDAARSIVERYIPERLNLS